MDVTGQTADLDAAEVSKPNRSWIGWVLLTFAIVYLAFYLIYAAYLALVGGEGAVPPTWRDPDIPAGAEVVSIGKSCGSGGCARMIRIRPAEGENVRDLAREMGVSEEPRTYGWRPTNPASVSVYVPYGDRPKNLLRVAVRYKSPFGY